MTDADALIDAFVLDQFRMNAHPSQQHLARCPSARVQSHTLSNGEYGCDTGCEYAELTAVIVCAHDHRTEHTYGDFGDIGTILRSVEEFAQRPIERPGDPGSTWIQRP